jgi:hypothetical protein
MKNDLEGIIYIFYCSLFIIHCFQVTNIVSVLLKLTIITSTI